MCKHVANFYTNLGVVLWLFLECFEDGFEVIFDCVDILDGLTKFSIESFVFFYLRGEDGNESVSPLG